MIRDIPVLALTPGEPAGIGPECAVRLLAGHPELCLVTVADPGLMAMAVEQVDADIGITRWQPGDDIAAGRINCFPLAMENPAIPGQLDPANAAYVVATIKAGVRLVRGGHVAGLVTGPVHKGVINDAGIAFSGHTELLADLAGVRKVVMMLAAGSLRVALVTTHLPLRDVPDAITFENVRDTIRITHVELRSRFGLHKPLIQVLGLNPHAGESGHLGSEDTRVIERAIIECRANDIDCTGPVPADTAFTPSRLDACDAVIAMYHDQGLPVLKHAGFGSSVNITLGLPFVRTSVDHGTALDIAGKNIADAASLHAAVALAQDLCR
jgi:4-hydroxythreonine-4-phosphate dehydrogenase